jgi:T5SS/PEP-CTERM-associated repeat protein
MALSTRAQTLSFRKHKRGIRHMNTPSLHTSGTRLHGLALYLVALFALFAAAQPSRAQTAWTDGDGDWFNAANWSNGVPTASIDAQLNNNPSSIANITVAGAAANELTLGSATGTNGAVKISLAGTLTTVAALNVGLSGNGTLTVSAGGTLAAGNYTYVGNEASSTGTFTISDEGSTMSNGADVIVGATGHGTMSITGGADVSTVGVAVGPGIGSVGILTVDGVGSTLTASQSVRLGYGGTGTLNITNGGAVACQDADLGLSEANGVGTVNVDGAGSAWSYSGLMIVGGLGGTGTINVTNGGTVSAGNSADSTVIGGNVESATGAVTIDGADSSWVNIQDFTIGRIGAGTLTIKNGGAVTAGSTIVSGTGTLDFRGASGGTLTVDQLQLAPLTALRFELGPPTGPINFITINGDLTLDGLLYVTSLGGMTTGSYPLISFTGALTDGGLMIAGLPPGVTAQIVIVPAVPLLVPGSVNLVVTEAPPPTPTPTPGATRAINLSTRMRVETGDNLGIGGFIVNGSGSKHLLLRAIGPSLSHSGVPNVMADPVLELHGPNGFVTVTNDNWRDTQEAEITATGIPPTNDFESAIDATLEPGTYTAIVSGKNNTVGVALVEIYDLDEVASSKLANLSTRAFVGTGDNVVIAGVRLSDDNGDDSVIVRGIGPSLSDSGLSPVLANPTLELRNSSGALLFSNNDWQDNQAQAAELTAAGLAPSNPLESGIAATLSPGLYTALLAGLNDGTGLGLVEIYDLGPP